MNTTTNPKPIKVCPQPSPLGSLPEPDADYVAGFDFYTFIGSGPAANPHKSGERRRNWFTGYRDGIRCQRVIDGQLLPWVGCEF